MIFGLTFIYKIVKRTPWRDPSTADLITGRKLLAEDQIEELEKYYKMTGWQRFKTYIQLW